MDESILCTCTAPGNIGNHESTKGDQPATTARSDEGQEEGASEEATQRVGG